MDVLPIYTNDEIVNQITYVSKGLTPNDNPVHFVPLVGNVITYDFNGFNNVLELSDLNGITSLYQDFALKAMGMISDATGLVFNAAGGNGTAMISFSNAYEGAFSRTQYYLGSNAITYSVVNIEPDWDYTNPEIGDYDSYLLQTFMHEIMHSLGFGHAGFYDGDDTTFPDNATFANDNWNATVMSYFSQFENTYGNYTPATALTLMAADVIALRNVYGTTDQTRTGDTRYGYMSDADGPVGDWLDFGNPTVMVVIDDGGEDVFDFSDYNGAQTIDLRQESFSNVYGEIGTVGISRGSVIENAIGGSASDTIYGNDVGNSLKGKNGSDELFGFGGADKLNGGKGADFIYGGGGKDTIKGGGANGEIYGDGGDDTIIGGSGRDTIIGGNGNDTIYGNGGGDALKGGGGNDILIGGKGNDRLIGGTGNDVLDGGIGNDILRGGDGDDQFVFNAADAGTDTLRDYGFGNDQIIIEGASAVDSFTNDGTDIFITVGVQTIIVEGGVAAGLTLGDLNFA